MAGGLKHTVGIVCWSLETTAVWDWSRAALGDLRSSGCDEWTLGDCSHGRLGAAAPAAAATVPSDHRVVINLSSPSDCNQQNHRGNEIFFLPLLIPLHGVQKRGMKMRIKPRVSN